MFLLLYNLFLFIILICASPILILLVLTQKHYRAGLGERLGFLKQTLSESKKPVLWIHGSSVGEIQTIIPFLDEIKLTFPQYQLFFSATTMTGIDLLRSKKLNCVYFPIDLYPIAQKVLNQINPKMIWILETELWPSFVSVAKKKKIPLSLINGRISDHSYKRYQLVHIWVKHVLNQFDHVLVQTNEDQKRFEGLGLDSNKCQVTGNIKFDAANLKKPSAIEIDEIKQIYGVEQTDLILVAGSTHGNEEKICAEIYQELSKKFYTLRLILAPRHLTRVKEIEKNLTKLGLNYTLRSKLGKRNARSPIILLDTIGELYKVYGLANIVYVGRSLSGFGGQNPLEPAIFAKPILFGPHMENFRQAAGELLKLRGAFCVSDKTELEEKITDLLHHPDQAIQTGQQAASIFTTHHGASQRTWQAIKK